MGHALLICVLLNSVLGQEPAYPERAWRLNHKEEGIVWVWQPAHTDPLNEIVVFVHGDNSSADHVWEKLGIVDQFRQSGIQALFVVPTSARQGWKDPIKWKGSQKLDELIQFAIAETQSSIDQPRITLVAHSAGFRVVARWLSHPGIKKVILSDSLFGYFPEFHQWLQASPDHQLILLVAEKGELTTKPWSWAFAQKYSEAAYFRGMPAGLVPEVNPPIVYIEVPLKHTAVFRSGEVLPYALRIRL